MNALGSFQKNLREKQEIKAGEKVISNLRDSQIILAVLRKRRPILRRAWKTGSQAWGKQGI